MIGKNGKISTFKHDQEMFEGRVSSQEFSVEGRVFIGDVGQLLEVEHQGSPGTVQKLLQNCTQVGVKSIYVYQEIWEHQGKDESALEQKIEDPWLL